MRRDTCAFFYRVNRVCNPDTLDKETSHLTEILMESGYSLKFIIHNRLDTRQKDI